MGVEIRVADRPGDLGWMVAKNAEVYAEQFGWDVSYEVLVARIVADFAGAGADDADGEGRGAWIADVDGHRVGCVLCVPSGQPGTAQLRILLVTPDARGLGAGTALVETCLAFARDAGYRAMTLWTNDVLVSARRIYQAAGFRLVDSAPHHSFGHDLVGQHWRLELGG